MKRTRRSPWSSLRPSRLTDPHDTPAAIAVALVLLVAEAVLCRFIIGNVPYTEIDWQAYMQEVQGYQDGELDYRNLKGGTGPLVYPAGFVYLFSWLQRATGGAVPAAQLIFAALYLATQALVMALYIRTRAMPPWSLALLCISRRLHSIFVLRLFNDCWAMFVAYAATYALQGRRWTAAILLYSLAVSIKMNVLLFAPGVLAVIIKEATVRDAVRGVAAGTVLQLALGAPFLLSHPASYLERAFDFSRVFMFKWSVNWQFLPEEWFLSKRLAVALVLLHLRLLWSFAEYQWFAEEGGIKAAWHKFLCRTPAPAPSSVEPAAEPPAEATEPPPPRGLDNKKLLHIVFVSNFVGILCARSLHYQFLSWYFHTLPYLLLQSALPWSIAWSVLFGIELVWNKFPPTPAASGTLLGLHLLVLLGTRWLRPAPEAPQRLRPRLQQRPRGPRRR